MGWSLGGDREKFTLQEMVEGFSFDRVSLGGPVFDLEKLSWLNGVYIRDLEPHELVRRLRGWLLSDEHLMRVVPLVRERIRRLDEFVPATEYFFSGDLDYAEVAKQMVPKERKPRDIAVLLGELTEEYDTLRGAFSAQVLEPRTRAFAEKRGYTTKELFMVLRLVITGRTASPPLFETMEVIGREIVRRRMRQAIEHLTKLKI
jgi:glutamyl-tRNA synthetase